jgi:hypothetical protein
MKQILRISKIINQSRIKSAKYNQYKCLIYNSLLLLFMLL